MLLGADIVKHLSLNGSSLQESLRVRLNLVKWTQMKLATKELLLDLRLVDSQLLWSLITVQRVTARHIHTNKLDKHKILSISETI